MSDEAITVICPSCFRRTTTKASVIGKKGRCACKRVFDIDGTRCSHTIYSDVDSLKQSVLQFKAVYSQTVELVSNGETLPSLRRWLREQQSDLFNNSKLEIWKPTVLFNSVSRKISFDRNYESAKEVNAIGYYWETRNGVSDLCRGFAGGPYRLDDKLPLPGFAHITCTCWLSPVLNDEQSAPVSISDIDNVLYRQSQMKVGAFSYSELCPPRNNSVDNLQALLQWAEFSRQYGWELRKDPYQNDDCG